MTLDIKVRKWFKVENKESIPEREGKRIVYEGYDVAIFNLGNEKYLAISNSCPHRGGPLSDGIISGKDIFCPLHNWKISLESGCVLSGGIGQVKVYPVKIHMGFIYVAFEEGFLRSNSSTESQLPCLGGEKHEQTISVG